MRQAPRRRGAPHRGTPLLARFDGVADEAVQSGAEAVGMVSHGVAIRVWLAARALNVTTEDVDGVPPRTTMPAAGALRRGVAETELALGALQIPLRAQLQLQVAGAMATEPRHIPGEARNEVGLLRVRLEVDEDLGLLRGQTQAKFRSRW